MCRVLFRWGENSSRGRLSHARVNVARVRPHVPLVTPDIRVLRQHGPRARIKYLDVSYGEFVAVVAPLAVTRLPARFTPSIAPDSGSWATPA